MRTLVNYIVIHMALTLHWFGFLTTERGQYIDWRRDWWFQREKRRSRRA